jgi:hypothetical protein
VFGDVIDEVKKYVNMIDFVEKIVIDAQIKTVDDDVEHFDAEK